MYDTYIIKKCQYSDKLCDHNVRFQNELLNTQKVQELGISPKLLDFDSTDYTLIIEKINGISLENLAFELKRNKQYNAVEFYENYIIPCIPLFEKLLTKLDIWDPNLGNILFDGTQFYLIDFDGRLIVNKNRILSILKHQIEGISYYN